MSSSLLPPTHRYAAAALFGLSLHQAQIHQTRLLGSFADEDDPSGERISSGSSSDSVSEDPLLWVHESAGLLRPIFRFLEIDNTAWTGLEETAGAPEAKRHIGAFLRLLTEESGEISSEMRDKEHALSNAVEAMGRSLQTAPSDIESKTEKQLEYEYVCRKKFSVETESDSESTNKNVESPQQSQRNTPSIQPKSNQSVSNVEEKPLEEVAMLSFQRKVIVLYELLSACLADLPANSKKEKQGKGYDARYRVALRLLTTWLDVKWSIMESIETMVACSAMAILKEKQLKEEGTDSPKSPWAKWKRGGIIGAAAITGGALMAITGGLAAPAIAAGLGALAPTVGLIPVIGAGFTAAASVAGTVAGSVAVAASFGAAGAGLSGTKMARRTGSVDEFEFKASGENHNQGRLAVEILVSGFVFEEEDFFKPWEGQQDNSERYILQWETEHLIAVSTAIQDWLTSSVAFSLMQQGAMLTVLGTLVSALAWPATLLAATNFIDSKWSIAVDRSDKAGKLLAEVLLKGLQGQRPVTLIGFSLGARVIYKCLQCLAESGRNAELVERVVLLGAPIAIKGENWGAARKVVSGRFVNAYSSSDWMLGVAFRASLLSRGLAGIQPVEVPGIENVDVTDIIEGHSSYLWATQKILDQLELEAYYPVYGGSATIKVG